MLTSVLTPFAPSIPFFTLSVLLGAPEADLYGLHHQGFLLNSHPIAPVTNDHKCSA